MLSSVFDMADKNGERDIHAPTPPSAPPVHITAEDTAVRGGAEGIPSAAPVLEVTAPSDDDRTSIPPEPTASSVDGSVHDGTEAQTIIDGPPGGRRDPGVATQVTQYAESDAGSHKSDLSHATHDGRSPSVEQWLETTLQASDREGPGDEERAQTTFMQVGPDVLIANVSPTDNATAPPDTTRDTALDTVSGPGETQIGQVAAFGATSTNGPLQPAGGRTSPWDGSQSDEDDGQSQQSDDGEVGNANGAHAHRPRLARSIDSAPSTVSSQTPTGRPGRGRPADTAWSRRSHAGPNFFQQVGTALRPLLPSSDTLWSLASEVARVPDTLSWGFSQLSHGWRSWTLGEEGYGNYVRDHNVGSTKLMIYPTGEFRIEGQTSGLGPSADGVGNVAYLYKKVRQAVERVESGATHTSRVGDRMGV